MYSVWPFLQEMFALYAIAAMGVVVRKNGILNENANDVLTQLILYITLPALIIISLDQTFSITYVKDFIILVTMSLYVLILSIILANRMRKSSQLGDKQKYVYEGLIVFGNQGYIGYAVSFILFGEQGVIYLTMFNICYLILIWTYGLYLFNHTKGKIYWKNILLNPGIVSTCIGLIMFLLPISLPIMIASALESIGEMTIPLSMLVIGSFIANISLKNLLRSLKNKYLWRVVMTRLLVIPLLLFPFGLLSLSFPVFATAVLISGMPAAPTISLYAQKYGADAQFASSGVLLTTILCIVSTPFLYLVILFITS